MASFTETVEAHNPALTATGLAIWGWLLRLVVTASFLALPHVIDTVTPLVEAPRLWRASTRCAGRRGDPPELAASMRDIARAAMMAPGQWQAWYRVCGLGALAFVALVFVMKAGGVRPGPARMRRCTRQRCGGQCPTLLEFSCGHSPHRSGLSLVGANDESLGSLFSKKACLFRILQPQRRLVSERKALQRQSLGSAIRCMLPIEWSTAETCPPPPSFWSSCPRISPPICRVSLPAGVSRNPSSKSVIAGWAAVLDRKNLGRLSRGWW